MMDAAYTNPDRDPRGPWRRGDVAARNYYSRGIYPITTPSGRQIPGPPSGSYWRVAEEELRRLDADGRVYWGPDGESRPYLKRYLSEVAAGRTVGSVWHPEEVGFVRNGKEECRALVGEVFATPKPERLMHRIIHVASEPGDVILDCFAGSGTSAAVAHKMGRRWATIEWERSTLEQFTYPRLVKVVRGEDPGGITGEMGWLGGGGFRVLDVGASMYEEDAGTVVLAAWATTHALAEATAAQLGFEYEASGPFCGRRGRTRLAVIDAMLSRDTVRFLADALGAGETLSAVGVGVEPGLDDYLQKLRPGSRARTAPQDLLLAYATPSAWRVAAVERDAAQISIFDPAVDVAPDVEASEAAS